MKKLAHSLINKVATDLAARNKEAARALPDSKGGETPKQLQTYRTQIYTYFTIADGATHLLYSAENWVRIKLDLETAGPVAIGTDQNIAPVLSGRGRLLDTDEQYETYLAKGTRVYIISETVNRIGVTIEPVPWLEQLSMQQASTAQVITQAVSAAAHLIVDAIHSLRRPADEVMAPVTRLPSPQNTPVIPRPLLTGVRGPKRMR